MKARDHIQRMAILIDGNKTLVADAIRKITGTKFNTIKLRGRIIDNSIDIFDYQSIFFIGFFGTFNFQRNRSKFLIF